MTYGYVESPGCACRYEALCRWDVLCSAWENLYQRTPAEARLRGAGLDGVTVALWAQEERERLRELVRDLRAGSYRAEGLLPFTITNGEKERRLQIPTVRDRIVQGAVKQLLEPFWESVFLSCSHGFRPHRSTQTAIVHVLWHQRRGFAWALKTDVCDCFDSINQSLLLQLLALTTDERILAVIKQWLPVGGIGIPQGAVISPLLCNIYLHLSDVALIAAGWALIRYADDLVILCRQPDGCLNALDAVQTSLASLGLATADEKTVIAPVTELRFFGRAFGGTGVTRLIVDRQGSRLYRRDGRLCVEAAGELTHSLPLELVEQVVVLGQGIQASTALLHSLVARGVDVVFMRENGRFAYRLAGPLAANAQLRVDQYNLQNQTERLVALVRAIVQGKLHNQKALLGRFGIDEHQSGPMIIEQQIEAANRASDLDALRGYEGLGARYYFSAWACIVDVNAWGFAGRAYHPPPDPINALLSFGYTLLLYEVLYHLHRIGLDPGIGLMHTIEYNRPSLALDLEEEFRPLVVDYIVLTMLNENVLARSDSGADQCLTDDARAVYLTLYNERLQARLRHPSGRSYTLRQCIGLQVEHLARCIQGRNEAYIPCTQG